MAHATAAVAFEAVSVGVTLEVFTEGAGMFVAGAVRVAAIVGPIAIAALALTALIFLIAVTNGTRI
jgi:hypothetical protein